MLILMWNCIYWCWWLNLCTEEEDDDWLDTTEEENLPHIPYTPAQYSATEMLERSEKFYSLMNLRRSVRFISPEPVPKQVIDNVIRTAGNAITIRIVAEVANPYSAQKTKKIKAKPLSPVLIHCVCVCVRHCTEWSSHWALDVCVGVWCRCQTQDQRDHWGGGGNKLQAKDGRQVGPWPEETEVFQIDKRPHNI